MITSLGSVIKRLLCKLLLLLSYRTLRDINYFLLFASQCGKIVLLGNHPVLKTRDQFVVINTTPTSISCSVASLVKNPYGRLGTRL